MSVPKNESPERRARRLATMSKYRKTHAAKIAEQKAEWTRKHRIYVRNWHHKWYRANEKTVKDRARKYYRANKTLVKKQNKAWVKNNPEKAKGYSTAYRKRFPERVRDSVRRCERGRVDKKKAYAKIYKEKNGNEMRRKAVLKYAARDKDKCRAQSSAWWKANRAKACAYAAKRRAMVRGTMIEDLTKYYATLLSNAIECSYCKIALSTEKHVDHMLPLNRGGTHTKENLCVTCPRCNLSKGDKTPEEFSEFRKLLA